MLKKALVPFLIGVSLLFLIGVRFIWLNHFPVGILHDEVDVVLSSKTYLRFGTDLSGIPFPKSLFITNTWAYLSGLPSYLMAPVYGFMNLTPMSMRLPYVFLSLITAYLISILVYKLVKNKVLFWITIFVSLVSPWLYFYSRQPTESPFALFFIILGTIILFTNKSTKIFYSYPFFLMSFFSYFGAKPVVPIAFILMALIHFYDAKFKHTKIYLGYISLIVISVVSYFVISLVIPGNTLDQRSGQVTFLNINKFEGLVDEQRRSSIEFPLKEAVFNKYTYFLRDGLNRYLQSFSPSYLLLKGDSMFTLNEHGVLYAFDILFIVVAVLSFATGGGKRNKKLILIALTYLFSGAVGPAMSTWPDQFVYRSFLHIPAFIILTALGIYTIYELIQNRRLKTAFVSSVAVLYLILFINFLSIFFFRYSIKEGDHHFISERVLSNYLKRSETLSKNIKVVVQETDRIFYQYAFYKNVYNDIKFLPEYKEETEIQSEGILFSQSCPSVIGDELVILEDRSDCDDFNINYVVIQNQKDAGYKFKIFNDKLCNQSELTVYRRSHLISDYDIENMTDSEFCNRWIQNGKTN